MTGSQRLRRSASVMLTATLLGGCAGGDTRTGAPAAVVHGRDDGYTGTLVADPSLRPARVTLHDTAGRRWEAARLGRDTVTALFFGFTHCDDVCPTTMADLAAARRSLPPELAARVQVVFVTVDPRRDTPTVLHLWLDRFDEDFVGLRGPVRSVHRLEDSLYAAPSAKEHVVGDHAHSDPAGESPEHGSYEVSHTGSVYLFAPGGLSVVHTGGTTVAGYAADLTRMVRRSGRRGCDRC